MTTTPGSANPTREQCLGTDEIRLLTIESAGDTLRLRTTPHKLGRALEYDAVSYVWGRAKASVIVSCNGRDLAITPTVFEMLQHLHLYRPDPSRPIWIDYICINQSDHREKAVQIPLMYQIYSQATLVLIWMGVSEPSIDTFMAEFPRVSEIARTIVAEPYTAWTQPDARMPDLDNPFWSGLIHLINNEWSQRLWTFQESVIAQKAMILCGSSCIDFDDFVDFLLDDNWLRGHIISVLSMASDVSRPSFGAGETYATIRLFIKKIRRSGSTYDSDIPQLINSMRLRRTQEPVDRVWAVIGLFDEDIQATLAPQVDYSLVERTEYWRTHIQFFKTLLATGRSLSLLCAVSTVERRPPSVPSWCPNLAGQSACFLFLIDSWAFPVRGQRYELMFQKEEDEEEQIALLATLEVHPHLDSPKKLISVCEDDNFLRLRGFVVDTIEEVVEDITLLGSQAYSQNPDFSTFTMDNPIHAANVGCFKRALKLARRVARKKTENVDDIPPEYLRAFWSDCRIRLEAARTAYEDAWVWFNSKPGHGLRDLEDMRKRRMLETGTRLLELTGHSFFSTVGGRFGIATPGCQPGDKVCVIYGGHPLHMLRWPDSNSDSSAAHGEGLAEFCGVAFIPYLMEPEESHAARLGPDEVFVIG